MDYWYEAPLAAFALRSAGPPVEDDRIDSAALVTQPAHDAPFGVREWPVGAARRQGEAMEKVARALTVHWRAGTPLVVADAPYALTLLDRELHRTRGARLTDYLALSSLCVLDPRVLDHHLDRARPVSRSLPELCARYGVPEPDTGTGAGTGSAGDATAALRVVRRLGSGFAPRLSRLSPAELHTLQAVWYAAQAHGPTPWFALGSAGRTVRPAWPLRMEKGRSAG
ncbi:3'-5' exonuclease [Streptomyces iconiensis]